MSRKNIRLDNGKNQQENTRFVFVPLQFDLRGSDGFERCIQSERAERANLETAGTGSWGLRIQTANSSESLGF